MNEYIEGAKQRYQEFTEWRRTRPFAGAVLLILGGMIVGYVPTQLLPDIAVLSGSFSFIGLVFAVLISLSGVLVLLRPEYSTFFGIAGVVLSTASILGALGGLFIGMFVGTVGGILCFAWRPVASGSEGQSGAPSVGRNVPVVILLCVVGLLLLYFAHPLLPFLSFPGVSAQQSAQDVRVANCDNPNIDTNTGSGVTNQRLACQNPPQGGAGDFGGFTLTLGRFVTPSIQTTDTQIETSEFDSVRGVTLEIENPDYTQGFTARKNFVNPDTGNPYHLSITSQSGSIDGTGGGVFSAPRIRIDTTEIYGRQITGTVTVLFVPIDFTQNKKLICEPRNWAFLDAGASLGADVTIDDLTTNAHFARAFEWTLNDFDLVVEEGTDYNPQVEVQSDNGNTFALGSGDADTCPATYDGA